VPVTTRVACSLIRPMLRLQRPHCEYVEPAARAMGSANPGAKCQHRQRDQCGLRDVCPARRPDALFVGLDPFLTAACPMVNLASAPRAPCDISNRDIAEIGGLMSYEPTIAEGFRQLGVYAGRILKGAKARGFAGRAVDQVRAGHQCRDRQDARPHRAGHAALDRRRDNRVKAR